MAGATLLLEPGASLGADAWAVPNVEGAGVSLRSPSASKPTLCFFGRSSLYFQFLLLGLEGGASCPASLYLITVLVGLDDSTVMRLLLLVPEIGKCLAASWSS